jgi:hypothetical protein
MAFADLQDLEDQLDFELDEGAQRAAVARLQQASDYAEHYAGTTWSESKAPRIVKSIVLNVVERYIRNPDGYTQSRAGDETLMWDDNAGKGTFFFTDEEKAILRGLVRVNPGLYSVQTFQHPVSAAADDYWVRTGDGLGMEMPLLTGSEARRMRRLEGLS